MVVPIFWPLVLTVGADDTWGGGGGGGAATFSAGLGAALTGSGGRGGVVGTAAVLDATLLTAMMTSLGQVCVESASQYAIFPGSAPVFAAAVAVQ
jgi:hypothetical protein